MADIGKVTPGSSIITRVPRDRAISDENKKKHDKEDDDAEKKDAEDGDEENGVDYYA